MQGISFLVNCQFLVHQSHILAYLYMRTVSIAHWCLRDGSMLILSEKVYMQADLSDMFHI